MAADTNGTRSLTFTGPWVPAAKEGEWYDDNLVGLGLRVSPKGKRSWFVRYRFPKGGPQRKENIGTFPRWTLSKARSEAKKIFGKIEDGEDPRGPDDLEDQGDLTFGDAVEVALTSLARKTRHRTIQERRRIVDKYLLPAWRDRPVGEIERGEVVDLVGEISDGGSPVMANRVLSAIRRLYNKMLDLRLVESNPATRPMDFYVDETPPERSLKRRELKAILKAVAEEGPEARAFFGLVAFTAQRAGAAGAATWEEFDLEEGTWTIPVEDGRKIKGYPRIVPLNDGAQRSIRVLMEETKVDPVYLFPSRRGSKDPHVSRSYWNNIVRRVRKRSEVTGWSIHDLRTTFRTTATGTLGISAETADLCLGHDLDTVGHRHYQSEKSLYHLPEKRDALVSWGRWVDEFMG